MRIWGAWFFLILLLSAENGLAWEHLQFNERSTQLPAAAWIPAKLSAKAPVGVLIWLHGAMSSSRCDKGLQAGSAVLPWIAARRVIIVSPSACEKRHWFSPQGIEAIDALLDSVSKRYTLDTNRIEIVGVSDGGLGALSYSLFGKRPIARRITFSSYPGVLFPIERIQELVNKNRVAQGEWILCGGGRDALYPAGPFQAWLSQFANRLPKAKVIWESQGEHDFSWWTQNRPDLLKGLLGSY